MFKKLLLILACSTACVCSGIEVAEKHLADLQKQYQAGMADALEMMQAEAGLIQTKAGLDMAVSEEEIASMIELRERIYRLTEARYKEGLCSYIKVYEAKLMLQQYSETFDHETIEQLHTEALRMIEQQAQNGCADALDNYAMQRFILENKLHLPETAKEERALLIQQMEQNFATRRNWHTLVIRKDSCPTIKCAKFKKTMPCSNLPWRWKRILQHPQVLQKKTVNFAILQAKMPRE